MDKRKAHDLLQHANELGLGTRTILFLRGIVAVEPPVAREPSRSDSFPLAGKCEKTMMDMAIFTAPIVIK